VCGTNDRLETPHPWLRCNPVIPGVTCVDHGAVLLAIQLAHPISLDRWTPDACCNSGAIDTESAHIDRNSDTFVVIHRSHVAWLVIILGSVAAGSTWLTIARIMQTARWPTVPGVMTAVSASPNRVVVPRTRLGLPVTQRSRIYVSYTCRVSDREYRGSRLSAALPSARDATRQAFMKYAIGNAVTVHYDPADPSTAVLETAIPGPLILEFLLAVGFTAAVLIGTRPHRWRDRGTDDSPDPRR
jgi:hypothetical protein